MKKLLLILGSPPEAVHPSIDCLLTAALVVQQQRGSRFLVIGHTGDASSFAEVRKAVTLMREDSPGGVKIVFIDCSPNNEEEVNYLLKLNPSEVCIYIFDHHENVFESLLNAAPNVSFTCNSEESTTAMASHLYYRSMSNNVWVKILTLQHFLCFCDILALDSLSITDSPISSLIAELVDTYNARGLFNDNIKELLFYFTRHVLDFVDSLNWSFRTSSGLDIYQRTGEYLETAISTKAFMEEVINGNDDALFSLPHVEKYKRRTRVWTHLIASSSLVSVLTGESVKSRFVGSVLVRPHQSRGDHPICWMNPECGKALRSRSKAVCLINATWEDQDVKDMVRIEISRISSVVNCLDVGLSLANVMSPDIVTVSGCDWSSSLRCEVNAYNRLEEHLKICRKAVELTNARPLPQPVIERPVTTKRASRQSVFNRRSGQTNLTGGRFSLGGPLLSQMRPKLSLKRSPFLSLGSEEVFDP